MRVPCYIGDLNRDSNLENYPHERNFYFCSKQTCRDPMRMQGDCVPGKPQCIELLSGRNGGASTSGGS